MGEDGLMERESLPIDPRYRAEFQRGYSGVVSPVPIAPTSPADGAIGVGLPPADVPTADVPPADVPPADVPPADVPIANSAVAKVASIAAQPVRPQRNPYIVLIVITGITSVGIGTWLWVSQILAGMSSAVSTVGFTPDSASSRFARALTYSFAGPLVTIGFLALLGVGFFIAARRRS